MESFEKILTLPEFWNGALYIRKEELSRAIESNDYPRTERNAKIISLIEKIQESLVLNHNLGRSYEDYKKMTTIGFLKTSPRDDFLVNIKDFMPSDKAVCKVVEYQNEVRVCL
jgi:hypothetical protein